MATAAVWVGDLLACSSTAGARTTWPRLRAVTTADVTLTVADGTLDVVVPGRTLTTFPAPDEPGTHPFSSDHPRTPTGVLVVR